MAKIKLEQVAQQAGVSVATVDRVLNRRSGVRPETAARVNDVIRQLSYQPDSLASRLARVHSRRFGFILPGGGNVFFKAVEAELQLNTYRCKQDGLEIQILYADVFDGQRLADALDNLGNDYDGIAVVALDHPAVREAIDTLVARGVHVVTLVSDLPGSRRSRFVGIDNHAAGRTAASLIGRFTAGRNGRVGLIAGSLALRDHAEREYGFEQVLSQEFGNLEALPPLEGFDDDRQARNVAARLLESECNMVALYSAGAGTAGIIQAIEDHDAGIVFVAHELNADTRRALIRGTVDAVINQNAAHEVRSTLRVLQALCNDKPIVESQERIRIDIFLRDNMPPLD